MFKTKIIKQISRIMVVLILLSGTLTLSGCRRSTNIPNKYECYAVSVFKHRISPMQMIAAYDTDIFDKNNITFNLAYTTHTSGYEKERSYGIYGDNELYFAIYISHYYNINNEYYIPFKAYEEGGLSKEELQNIDNFIFVKGITEQEAFSEEYAYNSTFFNKYYNHIESITIPWDYIANCDNRISIMFMAFCYVESCSGFRIAFDQRIDINCTEINDTQVKLSFGY